MISDGKLRALEEIAAADIEKDEFASSSMRSTLVHALCAELLQRRQADRAVWANAPKWANWFARDADGMGFYYSEEPERGLNGWFEGGEFWPMRDDGWQSTLQECPK